MKYHMDLIEYADVTSLDEVSLEHDVNLRLMKLLVELVAIGGHLNYWVHTTGVGPKWLVVPGRPIQYQYNSTICFLHFPLYC